jgi:glycosyltransferase involved in cell wall biosynthesis
VTEASATEASPLVTAILLTYDSEPYVAAALASVLAQDYRPMEVLISDDASTDGTYDVLQRELAGYAGPHRVRLRRREANSGSKSAHLNDVFPLCSGEVLVSFDADDVSGGHRVSRIVAAFRSDPRIQAVFSRYSLMDASGRPLGDATVPHPPSAEGTSAWFARVDANASGTTLAVRRDVVERFPPLIPEIAEDLVLPFRASLLGEVAFLDESLVTARRHPDSLTTDLERYDSIDRYRSRQELGIERAARNLESRLADLRVAESRSPERAHEWRRLEAVAVESLARARATADIVHPALGVRLLTLLRLIRSRWYLEHLPRHALLAIAPRWYLRYKRRALGAQGGAEPGS